MNPLERFALFLTKQNTAVAVFAVFLLVGVYVVFTTDLQAMGLIAILQPQAAALGLGIGLANVKLKKAPPGEKLLGYYAMLILTVVAVGAIEVLSAPLTYEGWVKSVTLWVAGLYVAKGVYANNSSGG